MPKGAALELLLQAYRDEIAWLLARAKESDASKTLAAADYIHRANNLQATIDGYERLTARAAAANEP